MRVTYGTSLNAAGKKSLSLRGGSRALMIAQDRPIMSSIMNPQIRIVHPKCSRGFGSILASIIGKRTPPREDPAMAIPIAAPRFFWKYCPVAVKAGVILIPMPIPPTSPCARMN